jgi:hypothetical protein
METALASDSVRGRIEKVICAQDIWPSGVPKLFSSLCAVPYCGEASGLSLVNSHHSAQASKKASAAAGQLDQAGRDTPAKMNLVEVKALITWPTAKPA